VVDPQAVMCAMARGQQIERLAAIGGAEQAGVLRVQPVHILWVSEDGGEIPGPLSEPSVVVHAPPMRAAVIRTVKTPLRRLDHRVDALGVRAGNRDMDAPENARRQAIAGQLAPAHASVGGTIQPTAWTTTGELPGLPSCLPQRGIDNFRVVRIEADVDGAGLLVPVKHFRPGFPAIGRAEHAALLVGTEAV